MGNNSSEAGAGRLRRRAEGALCALLVVMACAVTTWLCLEPGLIPPEQGPRDHFGRLEDRFGPARVHLQIAMRHGCTLPVGYYAGPIDWPSEEWRPGYFQARYALAPVPLDWTAEHPLVLTNLSSEATLDDYLATGEFRVVRRFDVGVALLERQARAAPESP